MSSNLSSNFLQFNFGMENGSKHSIYGFDKFRLDCDKLMLYSDGAPVTLPPKVVKTLAVLVENRGSILSKDELMESVWEDSIVEEANLSQNLYLLRKTLGSKPDGSPYIETLRRRGYRFNGEADLLVEQMPKAPPYPQMETSPAFVGVEREGNVLRVVDWKALEEQPESVPEPVAAPLAASSRPSILPRLAIAGAILLLTGGGGIFLWPRLMPASISAETQKELSVVKLTNGPFPYCATISRDGNVFVYHELDGEVGRMFVQQTGQASRLEIASSSDKAYQGKTFSPDGQSIYYGAVDKKTSSYSLYRIPTMGGSPVKLIDNIYGTVSFSPDGKEMAYARLNAKTNETSLLIADKEGKAERIVLHGRDPVLLQSSISWSPDGKSIAFVEMDLSSGRVSGTVHLYLLDIATGRVRQISPESWDNILRMMWMPDGEGIVMIATRANDGLSTRRDQVYYVSYPAGVSRRLTNDGNRHDPESLGVTANGDILFTPATRSTQIWSLNADGNPNSVVQLTRGVGDGRAGLAPLPDGSFGYLARNAEDLNIMLSNADASEIKQLATGLQFVEELRADPLGRFFVFSSNKEGRHHLFRIDIDAGGFRQLTFGEGSDIDSTVSPDGKFITFSSQGYVDGVLKNILKRIPAEGGEPVTFYSKHCFVPTYSPDGSLISCFSAEKPNVVIISAADGAEVERHSLPAFVTWNFGIGWTRDGSGLVYVYTDKGISNIWVQPRDGSKPKQLTNFSSGIIYRYAFSPDWSKLILARGYPTQDAVLLRNFR